MTSRIRHIICAEQTREMIAETCIRVEARNGLVQLPGTNQYYATDQESVWFIDTDGRLFKDFTEGSLSWLHRALSKDDGKPYVSVPSRPHDGKSLTYKLTALGRQIVQCCDQYRPHWGEAYANHVLYPVTAVMLRAMKRYARSITEWASVGATQTPEMIRLLERLVRFIRRVCGARRFTKALKAHQRKAQDNFNSARELIYDMATKHSRQLFLRIDLYCAPHIDAERAEKEINGLLRWLRSKACKRNLLPGYLGYIIKRENGLVRGMHWHLLVVCDGNLQRNGDYLTREVGEVWARRTGQGPGSYHNCWADRAKYDYDGLGVLELDDWEQMIGLRRILHYLTKQDCVLQLATGKAQNFRTSERKKCGRGSGRPRKNDNSLGLLRQMLGGKRSKDPRLRSASAIADSAVRAEGLGREPAEENRMRIAWNTRAKRCQPSTKAGAPEQDRVGGACGTQEVGLPRLPPGWARPRRPVSDPWPRERDAGPGRPGAGR